jgi:adenine-specific DNA-methyltransferase
MAGKTKLELTWIGKENRPRLEPRILLEDPSKSYHAAQRVTDHDLFDNRLIFGDNLLALKALEQEFTGKIKCVYIDPPFNTGEMFEHYDDGVEHSIWLTQMRDRLQILYRLLHLSGSLLVHIDDNELAYLIVLLDEIFGRKNRISVITFKQSSVSGPKAINPGLVSTASFILYYARSKEHWSSNRVYMPTERDDRYNRYIANFEESYANWRLRPLREAFAERLGIAAKDLKKTLGESLEDAMTDFVLENPRRVVRTARVAPKDINPDARAMLGESSAQSGRVFCSPREQKEPYYFLDGEQLIFYASKAKEIDGRWVTAEAASTIWDDLLSNNIHKEGGVEFPNGKKPEALLKRVIELCTAAGDWVLDSFAGSGTTGAVAHKLRRRWILVELRDHCETHVLPRLQRVVNGNDDSGVTDAAKWGGGGGFRYYHLAPSLLEKDKFGNWVISKEYNAAMLAEAMCKLEGFIYAPSADTYWQHGHSTERDFIWVTTQTLTRQVLAKLSDDVGEDRSLLICCGAFRSGTTEFPNLTLKKIPKAVMSRCEWGKDDYSLQIAALPKAAPAEADDAPPPPRLPPGEQRNRRKARVAEPSLFGGENGGAI